MPSFSNNTAFFYVTYDIIKMGLMLAEETIDKHTVTQDSINLFDSLSVCLCMSVCEKALTTAVWNQSIIKTTWKTSRMVLSRTNCWISNCHFFEVIYSAFRYTGPFLNLYTDNWLNIFAKFQKYRKATSLLWHSICENNLFCQYEHLNSVLQKWHYQHICFWFYDTYYVTYHQ